MFLNWRWLIDSRYLPKLGSCAAGPVPAPPRAARYPFHFVISRNVATPPQPTIH